MELEEDLRERVKRLLKEQADPISNGLGFSIEEYFKTFGGIEEITPEIQAIIDDLQNRGKSDDEELKEKIEEILKAQAKSRSNLGLSIEEYLWSYERIQMTPKVQIIINDLQKKIEPISDSKWKIFQARHFVLPKVIIDIVTKFKQNETLSQREKAIITTGYESKMHKGNVENIFKQLLNCEPSWDKNIVKSASEPYPSTRTHL